MTDYYKTDMAKLSFSEAWRWGGLNNVLLIAVLKLSGSKKYGASLIPATPAIIQLSACDINEDDRWAIDTVLKDLSLLGFEALWYFKNPKFKGTSEGVSAVAIHSSGNALCLVVCVVTGSKRQTVVSASSRLTSSKYLSTSNARFTFDPPNEISVLRLPGRTAVDVIKSHMNRIKGQEMRPFTKSEVEQQILEFQKMHIDHNLKRGLYVPV